MRTRSLRPLMAVAGLLTLTASCARAQDKPRADPRGAKPLDTTPWVPGPAEVARQGQGEAPDYAAFGLDLFRRLAEAKPGENVIVSPLSAGLAVSMVANGATGATRTGIEQALATGRGLDALNPANAALSAALRTEDVELAIANSLWAREGVPFLPTFLAVNRQFYQAEVATLDFNSPEAPRRINEWASRNTNGRITEMVQGPLDGDLIMYLMNAVYFKGRWQDEFQPSATRPRTFHSPGGDAQRPMMSRTGSYRHLQGEGFQGVRMPYRGDRFAMYVLLPDSGRTLAQLRTALTAEAWRGWVGRFAPREVRLTLPKYRMSLESRLNNPLQAMGMADAFDPGRARFDALLPAESLSRQNAYVGEAKQKVFIEVNEEGTEAAAVTGIEMRTTSAPAPPMEFTVDRPFVLVIRDDTTGALLFVGQVNDPVTQ
jgi:serine protease inhibitor